MKLTVLMPLDQDGIYFVHAIDSILKQDFTDFELLIISSVLLDNTQAIIEDYINKDGRVKQIFIKSKTLKSAIDKGLMESKGKYVAIHRANDYSIQGRFKKQVTFLDNNPKVVSVGGGVRIITRDRQILDHQLPFLLPEDIHAQLFTGSTLLLNSVLFRKKPLTEALPSGLTSNRDINYHLLWKRLLEIGEIYSLPELVYVYRQCNNELRVISNIKQELTMRSIDSLWKQQMPPSYSVFLIKNHYSYYKRIPIYGDNLASDYLKMNANIAIKSVRYYAFKVLLKQLIAMLIVGRPGLNALSERFRKIYKSKSK